MYPRGAALLYDFSGRREAGLYYGDLGFDGGLQN